MEESTFTIINTISFTELPKSLYKINDSLLLVGCISNLTVIDMSKSNEVIKEIKVKGRKVKSIKAIKNDLLLVKTNI